MVTTAAGKAGAVLLVSTDEALLRLLRRSLRRHLGPVAVGFTPDRAAALKSVTAGRRVDLALLELGVAPAELTFRLGCALRERFGHGCPSSASPTRPPGRRSPRPAPSASTSWSVRQLTRRPS